jgi:opacity protein-like surface antigen
MRKLALALATTAAVCAHTTVVFGSGATHVEQPASGFNGPYIGAGIGVATSSGDYKDRWGTSDSALQQVHKGNRSANGILGGINAGWDFIFSDQFLLGLEAYLDASGVEGRESADRGSGATNRAILTSKADMDWTVGVMARLGVLIDRGLLYATIGWAGTDMDLKGTLDLSGATPAGRVLGFKDSKFNNGVRAGVGASMMVTNNIMFGAEAAYTHYQNMTLRGYFTPNANEQGAGLALANTRQFVEFKNDPDLLEVRVKIAWKFNNLKFLNNSRV